MKRTSYRRFELQTKKMNIYKLIGVILCFFTLNTTSVFAQNGDQILDGIGETALIARYTFKDNVKDWSRNNLHGKIQGDYKFIVDDQFGKVLSLSGNDETFVSLPQGSLRGEESLSISGWIYLNSPKSDQVFFDFGKSSQSHFYVTHTENEGFKTQIITEDRNYQINSSELAPYKWNHLAVVIDMPAKLLRVYVNGKLESETKNLEIKLNQLFDINSVKNNKFYIGKLLASDNQFLNAKLFDFRIYRIPISESQVSTIHNKALHVEESAVRTRKERERSLPKFSETTPQLYNTFLTSIPDIDVETVVGVLPRLPRHVRGIYKNDFEDRT